MSKPRVFIASSSEGLNVARAIQVELEHDADIVLWTSSTFQPTDFAIEALERELETADCGIFVLTPDDLTYSRGRRRESPRDNLILELGMFAGKLGRRRAVMVHPRDSDLKLPSDLVGITPATYEHPEDPSRLANAVSPACHRIRLHLGNLPARHRYLSWEETCELTKKLAGKLRPSPAGGGFTFDAIVGLSRGGIIVADLLSRIFGGNIPVVCLWVDRRNAHPEIAFLASANWSNAYIVPTLQIDQVKNILLVDDITRKCETIVGAKRQLLRELPDKRIKSAILLAPRIAEPEIDYVARFADTGQIRTAFALVED